MTGFFLVYGFVSCFCCIQAFRSASPGSRLSQSIVDRSFSFDIFTRPDQVSRLTTRTSEHKVIPHNGWAGNRFLLFEFTATDNSLTCFLLALPMEVEPTPNEAKWQQIFNFNLDRMRDYRDSPVRPPSAPRRRA